MIKVGGKITKNTNEYYSADGERNAVIGLFNQYDVASSLIVENLRDLSWIKIIDREAGQLDDFQICIGNKIDAYQIKWHEYQSTDTLNSLLKKNENGESIFSQTAQSWKQIQEKNPEKKVFSHYLTNNIPSSTALDVEIESPRHFQAFIAECWNFFKKERKVPEKWKNVWNNLQSESGLTNEEFEKFVICHEFDFNFNLVDSSPFLRNFSVDVEHVHYTIFKAAASVPRKSKYTNKELKKMLGWDKRYEFQNNHEFQVSELYQPVKENVNTLSKLIDSTNKGYIGVFGTPGSGKSTFLSDFLRSRNERVILYYSYVPFSNSNHDRGEAENFFNDIILSFNREGFTNISSHGTSVSELKSVFLEYMELLNKDYLENGVKTIILIDGLDHIEREQNPQNSLLNHLLSPENIPEGIIFILGSQTENIIPINIQTSIKTNDKKLSMSLLTRENVHNISSTLSYASDSQKEKIFSLSSGHPLALNYIIKQLKICESTEEIDQSLKKINKYEGDIESLYESYWEPVKNDADLNEFLGLICRIRGNIDLTWAKNLTNMGAFNKFRENFLHYFEIDKVILNFFHNSFLLFLQDKTIELIPGQKDYTIEKKFHEKLAEAYSSSEESYLKWEEMYHRFKSNNYEKVLEITSQSYFREQFFNLRSCNDIKRDINIALKAVGKCKNPSALVELLLIKSEIEEREYSVNKITVMRMLIALDKIKFGENYLFSNNHLKVKKTDALQISEKLYEAGFKSEAKIVFDLSEPLNLLNNSKYIDLWTDNDKIKKLKTWCSSAIYFKKIEDIVKQIKQIKNVKSTHSIVPSRNSYKPYEYLQNVLLYEISFALQRTNRKTDLKKILKLENFEYRIYLKLQINLVNEYFESDYITDAKNIFENIISDIEMKKITITDKDLCFHIGQFYFLILKDKDKSKQIISKIPDLLTIDLEKHNNFSFDSFNKIFKLLRIWNLLYGKSPEIIINSQNICENTLNVLKDIIEYISNVWIKTWKEEEIDENIFLNKIEELISLYYLIKDNSRDLKSNWTEIFPFESVIDDMLCFFVTHTINHDSKQKNILKEVFEKEWENDSTSLWGNSLKRSIIDLLNNDFEDLNWTYSQLNLIEQNTYKMGITEKIDDLNEQIDFWLLLNEKEKALDNLHHMLNNSFGVYEDKDYQVSFWIEYMNNCIKSYSKSKNFISQLAYKLKALENITENWIILDASQELLSLTLNWNPKNSIKLLKWLFNNELILFEDILRTYILKSLDSDKYSCELIFSSIAYLMFPLCREFPDNFTKKVFIRVMDDHGRDELIKNVKFLVSKIKIFVSNKNRHSFLNGIIQILLDFNISYTAVGIDEKYIPKEKNTNVNELFLKNSDKMDENEVFNKISTTHEFKIILNEEKRHGESRFDWEPIIKEIILKKSNNEVIDMCETFQDNYQKINSNIGMKYIELFCNEIFKFNQKKAWDIGVKSLKQLEPRGWSSFWDGKSKIQIMKSLKHFNSTKIEDLFYETFINDTQSKYFPTKHVNYNLNEILSIIDKDIDKNMSKSMKEHLEYLLKNYEIDTSMKNLNFESVNPIDSYDALIYLLFYLINSKVNFISEYSSFIILAMLQKNDDSVKDVFKTFILKNEDFEEKLLMLLDSLSIKNIEIVKCFKEEINLLKKSPNYYIRKTSNELLNKVGD